MEIDLAKIRPTHSVVHTMTNENAPFTKKELWYRFKSVFEKMYEKQFNENPEVMSRVNALFYYFLKTETFFCNKNINKTSIPSLDKGICLIGDYGLGKSAIFKVFALIFKNINGYQFKYKTALELVEEYEACSKPNDKANFRKKYKNGILLIDDLLVEDDASNFGKKNVIKEVLLSRYDKNSKTHIILNYSDSNDKSVEKTLLKIKERYGDRIFDRCFEMFNIIEWKGKSLRR